MATTRRVGDNESENGFAGSGIVVGPFEGSERKWKWRVLSHDEEMRRECSLLYTTRLAGASWVLRTVCSPVLKSILEPMSECITS